MRTEKRKCTESQARYGTSSGRWQRPNTDSSGNACSWSSPQSPIRSHKYRNSTILENGGEGIQSRGCSGQRCPWPLTFPFLPPFARHTNCREQNRRWAPIWTVELANRQDLLMRKGVEDCTRGRLTANDDGDDLGLEIHEVLWKRCTWSFFCFKCLFT